MCNKCIKCFISKYIILYIISNDGFLLSVNIEINQCNQNHRPKRCFNNFFFFFLLKLLLKAADHKFCLFVAISVCICVIIFITWFVLRHGFSADSSNILR